MSQPWSLIRALILVGCGLTTFGGQLSAQTYPFSRSFEVTTPRMHGEDVQRLQQRLLDLGYTEVGEVDGYYGPDTHAAINRFRYQNGMQVDEIFHSVESPNLMFGNPVRGEPMAGPRPLVIAFEDHIVGGWLPGSGWVEKWELFRWFRFEETLRVRAWPEQQDGSTLSIMATVDGSGRHPDAPYRWLQAPRLEVVNPRSETGDKSWFSEDRWYVEASLHPGVTEPLRQPTNAMAQELEAFVDAWKRERAVDAPTNVLRLYELDVNRDGHADYVVHASSWIPGSLIPLGRQTEPHFTLFQLWLGMGNSDYEMIDFSSVSFSGGTHAEPEWLAFSSRRINFVGLFDFNNDGVPEFAYDWYDLDAGGTELVEIHSSQDLSSLIRVGFSLLFRNH